MPEDDVKMYGSDGREVRIPRQKYAEQVLPSQIFQSWDNPEALYATIAHAMGEGLADKVADAVQRLQAIDPNVERATVVQGIAWIQTGQSEKAEELFRSYTEKHGPAPTVLANQARIYFDRGETERAQTTLRQALSLDPNHPTALAWYVAMHEELASRTDQAAAELAVSQALTEIAKEPGSWRPQLFMASDLLRRQKKTEEAMELYRQILNGEQASAEAVTQLSADLAAAGKWAEMADLVYPVFRLQSHGIYAGMNLIQGLIAAKRRDEAAQLLRQLEELNNPQLAGPLARIAALLRPAAAKVAGSDALASSPNAAPAISLAPPAQVESAPAVKVVPVIDPLWLAPLGKVDWLPAPKPDAVKVAIFSLADGIRADVGKINTARLTRSLPLYLAEALRLRSDAASMCVVPVAARGGPVTIESPWQLDHMLSSCPPEFQPDIVICGILSKGARGARAELHIFGAKDRASLKTLRVTGEDFTAIGPRAEKQLLAALADFGVHAAASVLTIPSAADQYLDCLSNLAAQNFAAGGLIRPADLGDERAILDGHIATAKSEENSPLPSLVAAAGVATALRSNSPNAAQFKQPLIELLQSRSAKYPILAQALPVYANLLG